MPNVTNFCSKSRIVDPPNFSLHGGSGRIRRFVSWRHRLGGRLARTTSHLGPLTGTASPGPKERSSGSSQSECSSAPSAPRPLQMPRDSEQSKGNQCLPCSFPWRTAVLEKCDLATDQPLPKPSWPASWHGGRDLRPGTATSTTTSATLQTRSQAHLDGQVIVDTAALFEHKQPSRGKLTSALETKETEA